MRLLIPVLAVVSLSIGFFSCEKEPIERDVHENLVIDSNQIPPYNGVTSLQVKSYINKLYIDLTGLEPLDSELNDAFNKLINSDLSDSSRGEVIEDVLNSANYYDRIFEITSSNLLEGVDSFEIINEREEFVYLADFYYNNGEFVEAQILALEIYKFDRLLSARHDLRSGTIDIVRFYQRFIYNYFYDEINMGSLNFVVSCFESLLKRKPTDAELANGIEIVDGGTGQIFLQDGNSKGDFVLIITNVDEFFQGLVTDVYQSLLVRKPNSQEAAAGIQMIKTDGNLKSLQELVIKSQEYAGF